MNLQQFLDKHKSYKLNALSNMVTLEVDCKARNEYVTDDEVTDLTTLGYKNLTAEHFKEKDMCMMCCGVAVFYKPTFVHHTAAIESALEVLTKDHPEFDEDGTTGRDMMDALKEMLAYYKASLPT